jgi:hypothetical protein
MYENNIKKGLREKDRGVLNWTNLTQYNYSIQLPKIIKKMTGPLEYNNETFFSCNMRDFFPSVCNIVFSKKSMFHIPRASRM